MARIIPADFDVFNELIDVNEQIIRDVLKVKVNNWAKFRYSIYAGNSSDVLESNSSIDNNIRNAFIELAKSHYEVVNSLGYAKLSLNYIENVDKSKSDYLFLSFKWLKEFYIHVGSIFDNLARLIYILNSPDSATATKGNSLRLVRHWTDWNEIKQKKIFPHYNSFFNNQTLEEILLIRNNYVHNWRAPFIINSNTLEIFLPVEIRNDRNYPWPYEEINELNNKYKNFKSLFDFLNEDFSFVEDCQDKIFDLLIADLITFENNYNIKIREQWVVPGGGSDSIDFANSSASIPNEENN